MTTQLFDREGAVLKPAFREDGHVQPGDGLDAPRDNLSFQRIQLLHRIIGEFDKRNSFRYFYDIGAGERAEAFKAKVPGGCIGASVRAAQATAVGERMLDPPDAPAFLI